MDRFVPRDDAKRQWGQSPERTTLLHPDMQCRVFILRRADSCRPQPQMSASVQVGSGTTWLLRSERLGMPKTGWVGRVGLADMGEERLPCAAGP